MAKALDLIGKKFGRLSVLSKGNSKPNARFSIWNCICECGNSVTVIGSHLTLGNTKSCGCYMKERTIEVNTTHGMSNTEEYKIWKNLTNRCLNSNRSDYRNYGGKGITVCSRWINSFHNFLTDVGTRPSPTHILKRTDTSGNFNLENCHWVDRPNRKSNSKSESFGQSGWKDLSDFFSNNNK